MKEFEIEDFRLKIVLCALFFVLCIQAMQKGIEMNRGQSTKHKVQNTILNLKS